MKYRTVLLIFNLSILSCDGNKSDKYQSQPQVHAEADADAVVDANAEAEVIASTVKQPTESEFISLKKANDAIDQCIKEFGSSLLSGKIINNGDNIKEIMDGAIIRSEIGKKIRSNIQDRLSLVSTITESSESSEIIQINGDHNNLSNIAAKNLQLSDLAKTSGDYDLSQQYIDRNKEIIAKMENMTDKTRNKTIIILTMLKDISPELASLESEAKQLFQAMRASLEN